MSYYTRGMPMQEHRHIFVGIIYGSTIIVLLSLLSHSPARGMGSCFCVVSSSLLLYAQ